MPIRSKNKKYPHPDAQRDQQLLEVIRRLQEEIKSTLDPEESRRLNASLSQHLSRAKEPENRDQAIRKAIERIDEYPIVRARFSENLDKSTRWYTRPSGSDVGSIAGDLFDIEPGVLMVCPVEPDHYQRYRRNARQKLSCPHHNRRLVPAASPEPS